MIEENGAVSSAERHDAAIARLLAFFRARTGRWVTPTGEAWQPALAIEAVIDTYERTGAPHYRRVVERSFARYRGRRSRFHDDDGWYLNAWLRAGEVTGEAAFLDEARSLFADMTRGWDDTCGGGLWWRKDRVYKNAITNELFLLGSARLHRVAPRDDVYLDWALRAWRWFSASGMINASHQVNDGLDGSCANNGGPVWTYNQGVVLDGLAELSRVTGDEAYLEEARRIADAALRASVDPDGILREPCEDLGCDGDQQIFKGVFARGLAGLHGACGEPAYAAFLRANADAVWDRARDASAGVGLAWRGPAGAVTAATQAAACLLLGAVARLDAP